MRRESRVLRGCARRRRGATSAPGRRSWCRTGNQGPRRGWAAPRAAVSPARSTRRPGGASASVAAPSPSSRQSRRPSFGSQPIPLHERRPRRAGSPSADARRRASGAAPATRRRERRLGRGFRRGVGSSGAARHQHARRSDSPNRSTIIRTAARLRDGPRSFPRATSFNASILKQPTVQRSASTARSPACSFNRFASSAFNPPYCTRQRCNVGSDTSSCFATGGDLPALAQQPVRPPKFPG